MFLTAMSAGSISGSNLSSASTAARISLVLPTCLTLSWPRERRRIAAPPVHLRDIAVVKAMAALLILPPAIGGPPASDVFAGGGSGADGFGGVEQHLLERAGQVGV